MLSWKQCVLPVVTTMSLWQLMHLGTCASCAQVHELPQSHCFDNQEGTLFSRHVYFNRNFLKVII